MWIECHEEVFGKEEVLAIAEMLKTDVDSVVGKLLRVWLWANQQSRDGVFKFPCQQQAVEFIDKTTTCPGFSNAMQHVHWLNIGDDGELVVPNYDRHNGKLAKQQAKPNAG